MLLHDDFVAHGQTQAGAGAGRLGGKERLEDTGLNLDWNSSARVANGDSDISSRRQRTMVDMGMGDMHGGHDRAGMSGASGMQHQTGAMPPFAFPFPSYH